VYRAAQHIVSRHNGDNDINMQTNGEEALLRRALPAARIVFDVGANVGDWAAAALAINPAIELHAFEPSPTTFATLAARGLPANVTLVNAGLGRGATELLRANRIALITFEYGGTYIDSRSLLRDVWELVEAANPAYGFFKLHHDGPRRVERYRQAYETFQYSNWVIMAPDHPAAR